MQCKHFHFAKPEKQLWAAVSVATPRCSAYLSELKNQHVQQLMRDYKHVEYSHKGVKLRIHDVKVRRALIDN